MSSTPTRPHRPRRRVLAVALAAVLTVAGWMVGQLGYVSWSGTGCTAEGYPDPIPSYTELVHEYGKSPYCARSVRGETWF